MLRFLLSSAFLLLLLFSIGSARSGVPSSVIEKSEFWPYRVELTETVETPGEKLKEGRTGVLIRAEGGENGEIILVVDFGRHGSHELPPSATDIATRMQRIRTGKERKLLPNYVQMLANKFAVLRPESNDKLKLEEFEEVDKFVFVYPRSIDHIASLLDHVSRILEEEESVVIVLPEEGMAGEPFRAAVREHPVEAGVFFDHIALPYKLTLRHDAAEAGGFVVTDMNGLILQAVYLEDL
jgi:hypothetical protein